MNSLPSEKSKRRPRYKGKHPRHFHEKYKEHNPDRYATEIEKVVERGGTPVGTHRPICLEEILQILNPQPGEIGLDATLGYGGHAQALIQKLMPHGKLVALEQDPIERPKTEARLRANLSALAQPESALVVGGINFADAWSFLRSLGIGKVDFVLADLGLSSMQIDDPARGFSYSAAAPFDLRMNPQKGEPAAELLARLSDVEIEQILTENADEPHARQIARALAAAKPSTTTEVIRVVREVVKGFSAGVRGREGDTPIRRVFQALRIAVNSEFSVLEKFLADLPHFLKPGGRVAILSFHSGEDRRVKKAFQAGERGGFYSKVAPDPLRPSMEELRSNRRSRSAKLRWARAQQGS